ncbi:hypothetical protein JXI42_04090 [bacterium]|nr:hypothetical protein [bacterium]
MNEDKKNKFEYGILKVIGALALVILFILLSPTEEKDLQIPGKPIEEMIELKHETLEGKNIFISSLEKRGFQVEDNYPYYLLVKKDDLYENPLKYSIELSKEFYELTGDKIKIILDANQGKYVGYYRPEDE